MLERVSRMMPATANQPVVSAGRITCQIVPRPPAGSQRRCTAKKRMNSRPTQKPGTACPSTAKPRAR